MCFVLGPNYFILAFLGQIYKMLRFTWNLVPGLIWRCWFQICHYFLKILGPNYLIWAFLGKKCKMLRFTWNLVPGLIWRCWFQICHYFLKILGPNYLIWAFLGNKYKMLRFTWNLVPDLIRRCWFQIWHYFLKILDRNCLICRIFLAKNTKCSDLLEIWNLALKSFRDVQIGDCAYKLAIKAKQAPFSDNINYIPYFIWKLLIKLGWDPLYFSYPNKGKRKSFFKLLGRLYLVRTLITRNRFVSWGFSRSILVRINWICVFLNQFPWYIVWTGIREISKRNKLKVKFIPTTWDYEQNFV